MRSSGFDSGKWVARMAWPLNFEKMINSAICEEERSSGRERQWYDLSENGALQNALPA